MSIQPVALELFLAMKFLFATGVTLYIALTGYALSTGAIDAPFWSFVLASFKAIFFLFLCLEAVKVITSIGWATKVVRALSRIQPQHKSGS